MKTSDIGLFYPFSISRQNQFNHRYFYIYYIGAPNTYGNTFFKNRPEVPIYISKVDKQTSEHLGIDVFKVDWTAVNHFHIGQAIQQDGQPIALEKLDDSYENYIFTKDLYIPDPTSFQVRTLVEFVKQTDNHFFKHLAKISNLANELVYTYQGQDGLPIHIPAMETLRHFYVDSASTTLRDNILLPSAMTKTNFFRDFREEQPPIGFSKAYYLFMEHRTKKADIHKIFYFLHHPPFTQLFNNVWMNWTNHKVINAPIPSNKPLFIKAKYYKNNHGLLIMNIHKSTLMQFDENIFLDYQHPNDYDRKEEEYNRDESYDRYKKASKVDKNLDSKEKSNPQEIPFRAHREECLYDDQYNVKGLHAEATPVGTQQDRGGKTKYTTTETGIITTIPPTPSQGGDGIGLDTDTENEEVEEKQVSLSEAHNIIEIMKHIATQHCSIEASGSFYFPLPDCSKLEVDKNGKIKHCNKAEAYIDVKTKKQRKYTLFKVIDHEKNISYFCIDVEPKSKSKHMLIIFSAKDFEHFNRTIANPIILAQVIHNNHLWLKKDKPTEVKSFIRIAHTGNAVSMANKILKMTREMICTCKSKQYIKHKSPKIHDTMQYITGSIPKRGIL